MEKKDRVLEDVHAGTCCINNLISMLIILNCAHTQVEGVVCQNSRKERSTAVCDSCVAQLGETDNPQPAEPDKTATSLLRRLKIPLTGPCSYSLPSSVPGTLVVPLNASSPFKQSILFPITSPPPSVSSSYLSTETRLTRASWASEHDLRWSIISVLHLPSEGHEAELKSKHIHTSYMCTDRGTSYW